MKRLMLALAGLATLAAAAPAMAQYDNDDWRYHRDYRDNDESNYRDYDHDRGNHYGWWRRHHRYSYGYGRTRVCAWRYGERVCWWRNY